MTEDRLFEPEGEQLFEVNPSRLQCYLDCPRQYRFRYIDKRGERRTFSHTSVGRSVHKALRDFYALPPDQRTWPNLLTSLRKAWDPAGFGSRTDEEAGLVHAEDMLRRFFDAEDHARVRPIALESKFQYSHAGEGILITGRVDRLDASGDEYVIVDYKTGRYRQEASTIEESLPLSLYALAVSARLGRDVSRIVLHHLATGERAETRRDADRRSRDWNELIGVVDRMRHDTDFAPRPGPLCRWCDYLSVCPEGRQEAAG